MKAMVAVVFGVVLGASACSHGPRKPPDGPPPEYEPGRDWSGGAPVGSGSASAGKKAPAPLPED